MSDLIFLDVEASSLRQDSYPIEIGWARLSASGEIVVDAVLIKPDPSWVDWDEGAEKVHGLQMGELYAKGLSVDEAIARIGSSLAGETVFSDSDRDLTWCRRLFDLANRGSPFRWRHTDTLWIDNDHMVSDIAFEVATCLVDQSGPVVHRAGPDAARHAVFYTLARGIDRATGRRCDFAAAEEAGRRLIEPYMGLLKNRLPELDVVRAAILKIEAQLKADGVKSLSLFGSVVRGEAGINSDVDVMIDVEPEMKFSLVDLVGIQDLLARAVGRKVDVVEKKALGSELRKQVLDEAQLVF